MIKHPNDKFRVRVILKTDTKGFGISVTEILNADSKELGLEFILILKTDTKGFGVRMILNADTNGSICFAFSRS